MKTYWQTGYYAVLFDDFEQKIISTYIVFLWERDPCKAKWALAAKAYSIIRDQVGKEHAPLDVFLALVAELLGLVDPQHYLAVMGWEIAVNEVGNVSLMQNNTIEIGDNVLCTNISVEDIVTYACQHGYAGATRSFATMPSDKPVMAMAASAQFFSEKSMGNKDQENRQRALQDFTTEGLDETATIPHSMDSRIFNGSSNTTYAANNYPITTSPVSPGFDNFVNLNAASTNLIQQIISPNPQGSLMTNPTPLTTATSTVNHTNHYTIENLLDFDPDTERSVYDPADGDKWDVFDISAWVHADAYTN